MKFFSLIYQGDIHIADDEEKVLSAGEFSTLMTADEILEQAKKDVAEYKKQNKEDCENQLLEAQKAGFEEGLATFNSHLLQFERELKRLRHELQQHVLPIALKAAKKIVAKELELYPETIVDIVLAALQQATQNRRVTIYVNKADKEILDAQKPRLKEIFEHLDSLAVVERADVAPGGCVIETESGIINATIENQWRALEAAFAKYMKH